MPVIDTGTAQIRSLVAVRSSTQRVPCVATKPRLNSKYIKHRHLDTVPVMFNLGASTPYSPVSLRVEVGNIAVTKYNSPRVE